MITALRFLTSVALAAGFFGSPGAAAESQTVVAFERTLSNTVGYRYLLALPNGYDAGADKVWPLILFLHGAGERGSNPWLVAKHGPPKLLRTTTPPAADETPEARTRREESAQRLAAGFIVVSPQCPVDKTWDDASVMALLDEVSSRHRVDARRIYLIGLSMGGYGTWSVGLKNLPRFAALVPICGGGSLADVLLASRAAKAALAHIGIWAFHGAKDPIVPVSESERLVAALKKAGATDLQLTIYPEAKHDSWTETFANPDLYTWLLRHELPAR